MENPSMDELRHYGIPGMRWGRRKASDGGYEDSGKPKRGERSEDSAKVAELRRHPVKTLSNQEIETINRRLNLEQSLRNLESNASVMGRGRSAARGVLSDADMLNRGLRLTDSPAVELGRDIWRNTRK